MTSGISMQQTSFGFYEEQMVTEMTNEAALQMIGIAPGLTELDSNLLTALLHPASKLTALIPANASREDLLRNLKLLCQAHEGADKMLRKINPVLGRILSVIQESPEVYQSCGYDTFKEFMSGYVIGQLGCARSSAYQSLRLVKIHPSLPIEKWVDIGVNRLNTMAKFTKEGDPSYEKYLAVAAQAQTDEDFVQWAHDKELINKGDVTRVNVIIAVSRNTAQQWRDFKANSEIQATAGSEDGGEIFTMMMAECSSWLSPDAPRPAPVPAAPTGEVAFIWRCETCGTTGIVPTGYQGKTIDDLRHYIHDAHREAAQDCEVLVGNLGLELVGSDDDEEFVVVHETHN